jgi:hypothetical protein
MPRCQGGYTVLCCTRNVAAVYHGNQQHGNSMPSGALYAVTRVRQLQASPDPHLST